MCPVVQHYEQSESGTTRPRRLLTHWLVLAIGLTATVAISFWMWRMVRTQDHARFQNHVASVRDNIQDRLEMHTAFMRGGAGMFGVHTNVTRQEFHEFVQPLLVEKRHPEIQAIGFVKRVPVADKPALISQMAQEGEREFHLWPDSDQGEQYPVLFIEPQEELNLRAIGYDMFSEPVRRGAMERAADTAAPAATGKVTLVHDIDQPNKAGFLIFVPVYRDGVISADATQRRDQLLGFVYSAFRTDDLLRSIFAAGSPSNLPADIHPDLNLKIFDGPEASPDRLVYQSRLIDNPDDFLRKFQPRFEATTGFTFAGRPWTLVFSNRPTFASTLDHKLLLAIPAGGFLLSVILFLLVRSHTKARALAIKQREWAQREAEDRRQAEEAVRLTNEELQTTVEELEVTQEELRTQNDELVSTRQSIELERRRYLDLFEFAPDGYIITDLKAVIREANKVAATMLNLAQSALVGEPFMGFADVECADSLRTLLESVQADGRIEECDLRVQPARDSAFDAAATVGLLRDSEGRPIGFQWLIRDITERKQAQAAVLQSEARKGAMLESALDCIITMDDQGRIADFNPAAERTFGYTRQEVVGQNLAQMIIPPHLREAHHAGFRRFMQTGEGPVLGRRIEMPAMRADGSTFPCELAITVTRQGSQPPFFTAYLRDISERLRADEALRASESRFRTMADNSPIGVFLADRHGDCLYANPMYQRISGLSAEQVQGGWIKAIHPDDRERVVASWYEAARTGAQFESHHRYVHADGAIIWTDVQAAAIRSGEAIVGYAGTVQDITARRQADEGLARLATIVESSDDAIISNTAEGLITSFNPGAERMYGYSAAEVVGKHISMLLPEDRADEFPAIIDKLQRGERVDHYETMRRRKDGSLIDVSVSISPLRDEHGNLTGASKVARDITEQRKVLEALRRNEEELVEFFENAAVGLHWMGPDGVIMRANQTELILLGYTAQEYVGHHIGEFHVDQPAVQEILARLARGEPVRDYEARLRCKDGSIKHVLMDCNIKWENRQFKHARCFTRDVTHRRQAEESLRASESRLRQALEAGRMGSWEWQIVTGKVVWSPELEILHGLGPGTFGGNFDDFQRDIHPDDRERVLAKLEQTVQARRDLMVEYRIILPDGTVRWVEGRGQLVLDDQGRPERMVGVCVDVTERQKAQEALRQSEEQFRRALEEAPIPVIMQAEDGEVLQISKTWTQLTGYTIEDAPTLLTWQSDEYGYGGEQLRDRVRHLFAGHEGMVTTEFEIVTRGGERRLWAFSASSPGRLYDGRRFIVGMALDITERRRTEEELRHSEAQYRASFELAAVGKCQVEPQTGQFLRVNRKLCEITGYSAPELLNLTFPQITHADDRDVDFGEYQRLVRGEIKEYTVEKRYIRKDGTSAWVNVSSAAVRDAQGQPVHTTSVIQDINARKWAEAELAIHRERLEELVTVRTRQLDESHQRLRLSERMAALGTLSAGLGHDMGNLLLPLRLRLDAMEAKGVNPENREDLEAIRKCAEYLQRLANGLRLFALDPESGDSSAEPTNLTEWWPDVYSFFKNAMPRHITLEQRFDEGLPQVRIARPSLTQAIFNLIQNAGDALRESESGEVIVWAQPSPDRQAVRIGVTDNGPGMSPGVRQRCLEPFFTTKTRSISTGLGLALVHGIVQKASGTIEINSEPGRGTTFTLTLPAAIAAQGTQGSKEDRPLAVVSVGDDRMRAYLSSVLDSMAFQVLWDQRPSDRAQLWLTDPGNGVVEAARQFIEAAAGRYVIVFGKTFNPYPIKGLIEFDEPPNPAIIRQALRQVAGELSSIGRDEVTLGAPADHGVIG